MLTERAQLHQENALHPDQLLGMLTRAEAWLAIKALYQNTIRVDGVESEKMREAIITVSSVWGYPACITAITL